VGLLQCGARRAFLDREPCVLGDEIGVYGRGGGYTLRGGANNGRRQIGNVPRHPDTRQIRQASGIGRNELANTHRVRRRLESERNQDLGAGDHRCAHHQGLPWNHRAVSHADARDVVIGDYQANHASVDDADVARRQLLGLFVGESWSGVRKQDDIRRQLSKQ
jgi:hypothetical protein